MIVDPLSHSEAIKAQREIPYNVPRGEFFVCEPYALLEAVAMPLGGLILYAPLVLPADDTGLAALAIYVDTACATAGSGVRLGLYDDVQGKPGALIHDLGTVGITATGAKTANYTGPQPKRGRYWAAVGCGPNANNATKLISYKPGGHWYAAGLGATASISSFSLTASAAGYMATWTPGAETPSNGLPATASGLFAGSAFAVPIPRVLPKTAA